MVVADLAVAGVDLLEDASQREKMWGEGEMVWAGPSTSAAAIPLTSMAQLPGSHGGWMFDTCPCRNHQHLVHREPGIPPG